MDKLMMQNGFFGHTESTTKVSAGLKNTKIEIHKKKIEFVENCSKVEIINIEIRTNSFRDIVS